MSEIDKSPAAIARRRRAIEQAITENRLEGLTASPAPDDLDELYIQGEIDGAELIQRKDARFGRPPVAKG